MTLVNDKKLLRKKLQKDCQVCFTTKQDTGLIKVNGRMIDACPICVKKYQKERLDNNVKEST